MLGPLAPHPSAGHYTYPLILFSWNEIRRAPRRARSWELRSSSLVRSFASTAGQGGFLNDRKNWPQWGDWLLLVVPFWVSKLHHFWGPKLSHFDFKMMPFWTSKWLQNDQENKSQINSSTVHRSTDHRSTDQQITDQQIHRLETNRSTRFTLQINRWTDHRSTDDRITRSKRYLWFLD